MRIRSILASAMLAVGLVAAAGAVSAASAESTTAVAACKYRRAGSVWKCITPGAYCPKAAHGRYGYDKYKNRRYRCVKYPNGKWRWKRA